MTWDSLYELQPADTTVIADTDDVIRGLKAAIRERFAREHYFDLTDSADQGRHLPGTGRAWYQASAPTYRQPVGDLVALGADDAGQFWVDSDDKTLSVWDGDSFEFVNAATVGGYAVTTIGDGLKGKHGYIHSTNPTQNEIFDALDAAIPNTNDWCPLNGSLVFSAGITSLSRAVRTSSTQIILSGIITDLSTRSLAAEVITNGSSSQISGTPYVSISW